ncbi:hypothetical protein LCGC14_0209620 [marine sediment metagenome]|uniref:Uncharacterized protein n=1 Tax=marine sediment metagenome TaxID=412755 RepID=A0A0F9X134_9ZZZZ
MTKTELKAAHKELKKLNAVIAAAGKDNGIVITENAKNTEAYGERYVFVSIPKDDLKLRKQLKAIRYGASSRGKARWCREDSLWSIKASALKGTVFGS